MFALIEILPHLSENAQDRFPVRGRDPGEIRLDDRLRALGAAVPSVAAVTPLLASVEQGGLLGALGAGADDSPGKAGGQSLRSRAAVPQPTWGKGS